MHIVAVAPSLSTILRCFLSTIVGNTILQGTIVFRGERYPGNDTIGTSTLHRVPVPATTYAYPERTFVPVPGTRYMYNVPG